MDNKTILEKAIQKAIQNGWDFDGLLAPMDPGRYEVIAPFGGNYLRIKTTSWSGEESFESINSVIYSKNFAKALWGVHELTDDSNDDRYSCKKCDDSFWAYEYDNWSDSCWESRLQAMVIFPDPIAYLGEHLND